MAIPAGSLAGSGDSRQASRPGATSDSGLDVIPFPGTPDAAPASEIVFSSLPPSALRLVTVMGSRSGPHSGHLASLPDRSGTAFVADHAFAPGERVWVTARLRSPAWGAASGEPGVTRLRWSFTIGVTVIPRPPAPARPTKATASGPAQRFHSEPGLTPPPVRATSDPDVRAGDIFLTAYHTAQDGPMILSPQGKLLWFHPVGHQQSAHNLEAQRYLGRPVLTWWQGRVWAKGTKVLTDGVDVIMDRTYRTLAVVRAGNGYHADLHEFQITPQETAVIDASVPVQANLTSVGGPRKGVVMDSVIQELDIRTNRVLWEWHALGHVPLSASYAGTPQSGRSYDFFHLNSIQQLANGNLLISARNTWAVYEISHRTGRVIWSLGGKNSSFAMRPGTGFEWQHDAHLRGLTLSVFDDGSYPQEEQQSSAKLLKLSYGAMTVTPAHRYTHDPPLLSGVAGSAQVLPNHNVFVGWGSEPEFSEYSPGGRQIFNGSLPLGTDSYRAYRFPWVGQPSTRPSLAALRKSNRSVTLYVSWNGATSVAAWRALSGATRATLRPLSRPVPWHGFETAIRLSTSPRYVAVQALDTSGHVLATSRTQAASP